uniref:AlNc14C128G6876 protein n=1 Tax=Albugo laibachii Nc14 TaxID=890382 RepID=F0WK22_9STRA|nr:AlNc14C128G6876 [Albugo laibachii Nc14]|eukprot:CCA21624.1 AlNc14C128G6876 [Albugo laibachii Nc14]
MIVPKKNQKETLFVEMQCENTEDRFWQTRSRISAVTNTLLHSKPPNFANSRTSVATTAQISSGSRESAHHAAQTENGRKFVTSPTSSYDAGEGPYLETWVFWKRDLLKSESWVKVFATLNNRILTILEQPSCGVEPLLELKVARVEATTIGGLFVFDPAGRIFEFFLFNSNDHFFEWYEALAIAAENTVGNHGPSTNLASDDIDPAEFENCMACWPFQKFRRKCLERIEAKITV